MQKKGSEGRVAEQDCRDCRFQATISNSRQTPCPQTDWEENLDPLQELIAELDTEAKMRGIQLPQRRPLGVDVNAKSSL